MFTIAIISAVSVAASVVAVVKTKQIIAMAGRSCPTQCILDDRAV